MPIERYSNNASSALALAMDASTSTLTLINGSGAKFPTTGNATWPPGETYGFRLTIMKADKSGTPEIVWVDSRNGDVCQVRRAQEGTTAQSWNAGDIVANLNTAGTEERQLQPAQVQSGFLSYTEATGTGNALVAPIPLGGQLSTMSAGLCMYVKVPANNAGGPMTLKLGSFPATTVLDWRGGTPAASSLSAGGVYRFTYDGNNWIVAVPYVKSWYYIDSATANVGNAVLVDPSADLGTVTALSAGTLVRVRMRAANTGPMTLKFGSLGPAPVKAQDGSAVQPGMTSAQGTYDFMWDGSAWASNIINRQTFPIGTIIDWYGDRNNVTSAFGPGWFVADGTNGTPDLRDRVTVGAGSSYAMGTSGGSNTVTLGVNHLPAHSHGVNDLGHSHSASQPAHTHGASQDAHNHYINQSPHSHGVNDPSHQHIVPWGERPQTYNPPWGTWGNNLTGNGDQDYDNTWGMTSPTQTGISLQGANANISLNPAQPNVYIAAAQPGVNVNPNVTGISIQSTGGGNAVDIRQPWLAVWKVIRMS